MAKIANGSQPSWCNVLDQQSGTGGSGSGENGRVLVNLPVNGQPAGSRVFTPNQGTVVTSFGQQNFGGGSFARIATMVNVYSALFEATRPLSRDSSSLSPMVKQVGSQLRGFKGELRVLSNKVHR